jgi:Sec-independent protein secretion pathway component TatC
VLNPATDAISMTMLAIPLVGLFELGLVMGARAERRKKLESH